jgi:rubrerythrin
MTEKNTAAKLNPGDLLFLDKCAALEGKIAEVYHHLEAVFADDLPLSRLWHKTATEEENHAQQFHLGVRLKGAGMKNVNMGLDQGIEYIRKVTDYLDKLLHIQPVAEEALTWAIKLEEQLAALHMSSIVNFEDPEVKKLFEAMMKSDQEHMSRLEAFLAARRSGKNVPEGQ